MTEKRISAGILGTGWSVPDKVVTNQDLAQLVDTNDAWITERTGIRERRVAPEDMPVSELAYRAAKMALEDAKTAPEELDLIIVATLTSDRIIPSTACVLQDRLGAVRAAAFDLSAACSGFAYASTVAAQFIEGGVYRKVLVIGAETLSKVVDWTDRNTCILFGDGAGAAVYGPVEDGYGLLSFDLGSDGSGADVLDIPSSGSLRPVTAETLEQRLNFIQMDGKAVPSADPQGACTNTPPPLPQLSAAPVRPIDTAVVPSLPFPSLPLLFCPYTVDYILIIAKYLTIV